MIDDGRVDALSGKVSRDGIKNIEADVYDDQQESDDKHVRVICFMNPERNASGSGGMSGARGASCRDFGGKQASHAGA
ncbi:hypothetical protein, partial [Camelimonas abortus]|uniref:hypothetical protein n=1 Tax=Camelimonas abortus TaxID=1017184 RepID=UPI00366A8C08